MTLDSLRTLVLAPTPIACLRHIGNYSDIGSTFDHLMSWAHPRGVTRQRDWFTLGIYYDDPGRTPAEALRADAAITVAADFSWTPEDNETGLALRVLPGGTYVVATHRGSYAALGEAWGAFMQAAFREYRLPMPPLTPCFEIYRNDCHNVPEADLRTDLHIALELTSAPLVP